MQSHESLVMTGGLHLSFGFISSALGAEVGTILALVEGVRFFFG